jgi:hypothetical protein
MDGADARDQSGSESVKAALITIATRKKYHHYAGAMFKSAKEFFPLAERIAFTDGIGCDDPETDIVVPFIANADKCLLIPTAEYPEVTLKRYHTILSFYDELKDYDQIFWIDADMRFVALVGEEIFSSGITATLHPGYVGERGTPERNPFSSCFIPFNAQNKYFCGGFNGGSTEAFLKMAEICADSIDIDARNGIIPLWHDESATNHYLYKYPPSKILDPSYCYPEGAGDHYLNKWRAAGINPTPKILALTKVGR